MELLRFEELVKSFREKKESVRFTNSGKDHAQIVVKELIESANGSVHLYSGKFDETFYSTIEPSLTAAIARISGEFSVIVDTGVCLRQNSLFDRLLSTSPKGKLRFFERTISGNRPGNHFLVVDDEAYRFETDDALCKAVCNFNEPEIAIRLVGSFNEVKGNEISFN
jgi:hypothetical protein